MARSAAGATTARPAVNRLRMGVHLSRPGRVAKGGKPPIGGCLRLEASVDVLRHDLSDSFLARSGGMAGLLVVPGVEAGIVDPGVEGAHLVTAGGAADVDVAHRDLGRGAGDRGVELVGQLVQRLFLFGGEPERTETAFALLAV